MYADEPCGDDVYGGSAVMNYVVIMGGGDNCVDDNGKGAGDHCSSNLTDKTGATPANTTCSSKIVTAFCRSDGDRSNENTEFLLAYDKKSSVHLLESECLLIGRMFARVGRWITAWPKCFLLAGILASLLSIGIRDMYLKDRIRDGYTAENAPSRRETEVMREFWNATGDPIMTIVLVRAADGGSMLRFSRLQEALRVYDFLMNNFTISAGDDGGRRTRYAELCFPYCETNRPLEVFLDGLENEMYLESSNQTLSSETNLTYPVSTVQRYKIHVERMFFGVQLKNESVEYSEPEQRVTNMESMTVVLLLFQGDRSTSEKGDQLSRWELSVYDFFNNNYTSEALDVQVIGTEILDYEMLKDGQRMVPYFSLGFLATTLFVFATVICSTVYLDSFDVGKLLIAAATIASPSLSISLTFGVFSLLGIRINSFLLVLPYLVLGIGVDDGFLLMHAWFCTAGRVHDEHRLELVLSEAGPSITVTTLTNVISFGIGAFSPTPEIRLFCSGTTIALSAVYILQFFILCPTLYLTRRFERKSKLNARWVNNNENSHCHQRQDGIVKHDSTDCHKSVVEFVENGVSGDGSSFVFSSAAVKTDTLRLSCGACLKNWFDKAVGSVFRIYCTVVPNRWFIALVGVSMLGYWYAAFVGTSAMRARLDATKVLPRDSQIRRTNIILDDCVWKEYLPVTVIVNQEFDITNRTQYELFYAMVDEFESLPKCKGSQSSMIWLRDYEEYYRRALQDAEEGGYFDLSLIDMLLPESGTDESTPPTYRRKRSSLSIVNSTIADSKVEEVVATNHFSDGVLKEKEENNGQVTVDFCKLDDFLDSAFYHFWSAFVRVNRDSDSTCPRIQRFWFTVAYHQTPTWEDRIALMKEWRAIAHRYHDELNVSVWETNGMFVDQMLSLKWTTIQSGLLTLCCMFVICAFFIPNPWSVLIASAVIASICLGVFGSLSLLGFDLDPITMAALLMSIGLSVDYTAHVAYHFQQNSMNRFTADGRAVRVALVNRHEKLRHTIEAVGWPMLQAGISTVLCVAPMILIQKYVAGVFFYTILIVTILGMWHGVVVLPCALNVLPMWCTSGNFYAIYCASSARKSYSFHNKDGDEQGGDISAKPRDEGAFNVTYSTRGTMRLNVGGLDDYLTAEETMIAGPMKGALIVPQLTAEKERQALSEDLSDGTEGEVEEEVLGMV